MTVTETYKLEQEIVRLKKVIRLLGHGRDGASPYDDI